MAGVTLAPFTGWPPEALTWFRDLEADNSRAWFQAHRATYDRAVRGPFESLLGEAVGEFGDGAVARPNRDTRFSADKSPYKTRCYARVPRLDGGGSYFVQVHAGGLFAGGGAYMPERPRLAALRRAMADDRTGAELEAIVAGMEAAGLSLIYGLMGVLNFAHGAFLTLGAFTGWEIARRTGSDSWWTFLLSLLVGAGSSLRVRGVTPHFG